MSQVQERVAATDIDERWLPPSPHREKILEKIAEGRAHIEEAGPQPAAAGLLRGRRHDGAAARALDRSQPICAGHVGGRRCAPNSLHRRLRQYRRTEAH